MRRRAVVIVVVEHFTCEIACIIGFVLVIFAGDSTSCSSGSNSGGSGGNHAPTTHEIRRAQRGEKREAERERERESVRV